ncbi:uncharacterized protein LOC112567668 isoform X6 [Pomacea canaliculata]|uniref:uncharacterized protein LOC112567668 isoform X6 n=1 Tax=Pomacea canaliculata TaxID=400727 RepID=UPI000D739DF0|nr:uncharacterized protein LOC112567668 isoform X6 [Pomacea canaliculata]
MESGENKSKILTDEEKKFRETPTIKPDHIYWRKKLPRGFQYYMERLMRGIVRVQPSNIPAFAAVYLEELLAQRNKELENLPQITYLQRIENNMKQPWYGQDPLHRTTAVMQTSSTLLHKYLKPSEYSQTGELPKSEGIQVDFPKEEGTQTDTSQVNWNFLQSPAERKRDFLGEHTQTSGICSARDTQSCQTQTCQSACSKTNENMSEKTSENISENTAEKKPEMYPSDDVCDHKPMRFYCHPPPYHSFIRLTGCSCAPPRQPHLNNQSQMSQNASSSGAPYSQSHPVHHFCPCDAPQTFDYNKNQMFSSHQPVQDSTGTQDQQFHMEALEELFMESVGTHMHAARKDRNHKVGLQQTQFDSSNSSKNFVSLARESTTYRVPQSEEPGSRLSSPPYVRPSKRDMATSCSQITWSERIEPPTSRSLTPSPEMKQSRQKKHCRHHHHHHHHCQHRHKRGKSKQRKKETAQSQTQPAPIYPVYQMPPWLQQPVDFSPPFTWTPLHTCQQVPGVSAPVQVYNPFHPLVIPPVQVNVGYPPFPAALQSEVTCCSCARRALDALRPSGLWKDTRTCHFCHPGCQTREVATQNEDLTNIETVSHRVQQVSQKSASTCCCGHKQTTSLEMKDELTISYRVTTPESGKDSHILSSCTTQSDLKKIKAEIKSSYRSVCLQCSSGDPDQPSSLCSECSETIRLIMGGTPSTPSPDGKPDQPKSDQPCGQELNVYSQVVRGLERTDASADVCCQTSEASKIHNVAACCQTSQGVCNMNLRPASAQTSEVLERNVPCPRCGKSATRDRSRSPCNCKSSWSASSCRPVSDLSYTREVCCAQTSPFDLQQMIEVHEEQSPPCENCKAQQIAATSIQNALDILSKKKDLTETDVAGTAMQYEYSAYSSSRLGTPEKCEECARRANCTCQLETFSQTSPGLGTPDKCKECAKRASCICQLDTFSQTSSALLTPEKCEECAKRGKCPCQLETFSQTSPALGSPGKCEDCAKRAKCTCQAETFSQTSPALVTAEKCEKCAKRDECTCQLESFSQTSPGTCQFETFSQTSPALVTPEKCGECAKREKCTCQLETFSQTSPALGSPGKCEDCAKRAKCPCQLETFAQTSPGPCQLATFSQTSPAPVSPGKCGDCARRATCTCQNDTTSQTSPALATPEICENCGRFSRCSCQLETFSVASSAVVTPEKCEARRSTCTCRTPPDKMQQASAFRLHRV